MDVEIEVKEYSGSLLKGGFGGWKFMWRGSQSSTRNKRLLVMSYCSVMGLMIIFQAPMEIRRRRTLSTAAFFSKLLMI